MGSGSHWEQRLLAVNDTDLLLAGALPAAALAVIVQILFDRLERRGAHNRQHNIKDTEA